MTSSTEGAGEVAESKSAERRAEVSAGRAAAHGRPGNPEDLEAAMLTQFADHYASRPLGQRKRGRLAPIDDSAESN